MSTKTKPTQKITQLQKSLGYSFTNDELLWQAITHSTAINENNPEAYDHNLTPLAFVGDAALKYAIARQLYINGPDDVIKSPDELHKSTQIVISNAALKKIAHEKLQLQEYLIRGKNHRELSEKMYADCLEAIFGAIALDCGDNQRQGVLELIPKICFQQTDGLLKPAAQDGSTSMSTHTIGNLLGTNRRAGRIDDYHSDWPMILLKPATTNSKTISLQHRSSGWKRLGQCFCIR